jgi:serine/threonine protein kinase
LTCTFIYLHYYLCTLISQSNKLYTTNFEWQLILFMQLFVTPSHLAIVLEYAAGGELFHWITHRGRLSEPEVQNCYIHIYIITHLRACAHTYISEYFYFFLLLISCMLQARYFFQQLISGVQYIHSMVYMHIQIFFFNSS